MNTQRHQRGHDFLPPAEMLRQIPGAYGSEDIPLQDKIIWLHYFSAANDHYLAEVWHEPGAEGEPGRWMGFGYARLAACPEGAEWGYIDLDELERLRARTSDGLPVLIERDLGWEPTTFRQIRQAQRESGQTDAVLSLDPEGSRQAAGDYYALRQQLEAGQDDPGHQRLGEREAWEREATEAAGNSMPDEWRMTCPGCDKEAVNQPPADLVPREAYDIPTPQWSHRDRSSLCPVPGPSGGYRPAEPRAAQPELADPDIHTMRLEPPASLRPSMRAEIARQLAERADPAPAAPAAGVIGREYATRVIARLGELHWQAPTQQPEPEPEAGA